MRQTVIEDGVRDDRAAGRAAPGTSDRRRPDDAVDRALMRGLAAGDLDALATLYDRYRVMAFSVALRVTADPTAAEDVLQEAFIGVWSHPGSYAEGRGTVKTWLLAIVRHRAIDELRRRRATVELPQPDDAPPAALQSVDVWPEISGRLDADAMRSALRRIPSAQRDAVELAYFADMTHDQIAVHTGVPLGTAKSRVRLGLLTLRKLLLETAYDPMRDKRTR